MRGNNTIEIYRMLNSFDRNGVLKSTIVSELPATKRICELASHSRSSKSHAGIYFSATTKFDYVLEYAQKHPELNFGIAKFIVDLVNMPDELIAIYPVMLREYWVSELANCNGILSGNPIKDPYSGNEKFMLGILQPSQQSVSSWCSKSFQVILQCNGLQMEIIENPVEYAKNLEHYNFLEVQEKLIKLVPKVNNEKFDTLCNRVITDLHCSNNKNYYLEVALPKMKEKIVA